MRASRALPAAVLLLLVLPVVTPAVSASETCADCPAIALFFQGSGTMTTMPGESAVVMAGGGNLTQASAKLSKDLRLVAASGFDVHLPQRTRSGAGNYTTTVTVFASPLADLTTRTIVAQRTFVSAQAAPAGTDARVDPLRAAAGLVGGALGQVPDPDAPQLAPLVNASLCAERVGPLFAPQQQWDACAAYQGDWRVSNFRLCTGTAATGQPMPGGSGLSPAVLRGETPELAPLPLVPDSPNPTARVVTQTVNGASRTASDATVGVANDLLNESYPAGTTPDLCGEASPRNTTERNAPPVPEPPATGVDAAGVLRAAMETHVQETDATDWTFFHLEAQPTDASGDVVVPRGWHLAVQIRVQDPEGVTSAIPYGRANLPAALVLRPAERGWFDRFTPQAESIGLGTHSGAPANPDDADVYAIELDEGRRARILSSTAITVYTPSGVASSGRSHEFTVNESGRTILHVPPTTTQTIPPGEYRFTVAYVDNLGQDDAQSGRDATAATPIVVDEGAIMGYIGENDDIDVYRFSVDQGQPFRLVLTAAPTLEAEIGLASSGSTLWMMRWSGHDLDGASNRTQALTVEIRRLAGEGSYQLTLDRDERFALAGSLPMSVGWAGLPVAGLDVESLAEVAGRPAFRDEEIVLLEANGTLTRLPGDGLHRQMTELADGSRTGSRASTVAVSGDPGAIGDSYGGGHAVAEDGALWWSGPRLDDDGSLPPSCGVTALIDCPLVMRTHQGTSEIVMELPRGWIPQSLATTPDSTLFLAFGLSDSFRAAAVVARHPSGELEVFDLGRFPIMDLATDAEGAVYALTYDGRVLRLGPEGFRPFTHAEMAQGRSLAVAAGGIVAFSTGARTQLFESPALGLVAPHPALDIGPRPDLVVRDVRSEARDLTQVQPFVTHDLVITVANVGAARAAWSNITVDQECVIPCTFAESSVGALEPGATQEIRVGWAPEAHPGSQRVRVRVDSIPPAPWAMSSSGRVMESDETNNVAVFTSVSGVDHNAALRENGVVFEVFV